VIRILITDGSGECDRSLAESDVDFIQVREPGFSTRALACCVRALVREGGPRILVNDRADVAIACGAAGVHLRSGSVSPKVIRRITLAGFIITVACHDADAVFLAEEEGADYAVLAPVFAPLSKPIEWPPLGLDSLRTITLRTKIPVIALGGVTVDNAPLCVEAGAAGVAGITLFRALGHARRPLS
jgi:thiamine-phosphate pyrophosphorylase